MDGFSLGSLVFFFFLGGETFFFFFVGGNCVFLGGELLFRILGKLGTMESFSIQREFQKSERNKERIRGWLTLATS